MAKYSEHKSRTGSDLLVGHGDNATVVHELSNDTPQRIEHESISPTNGAVLDREV